MAWRSASEFFAMGGYALYVWGAYAVTALGLLIDPLMARQRHRQAGRAAGLKLEEVRLEEVRLEDVQLKDVRLEADRTPS